MDRLLSLCRRSVETVSVAGGQMAKGAILLMMGLIVYDVLMRYVFMSPTLFGDEVSGYLLVMAAFLPLAITLKEDRHIRVDVLTKRLPARHQVWLELILSIISIAAVTILLWRSIILTQNLYIRGVIFPSVLQTPLYIPQSLIPLGLSMLLLQYIVEVVKIVRYKVVKAPP